MLDYELTVYLCNGTPDERIEWFNIINIAGVELKPQEIRNANFTGTWLSDAKRYFSKKTNNQLRQFCYNNKEKDTLLAGEIDRQGILEQVIDWLAQDKYQEIKDKDKRIRQYMADRQNDSDANEIWTYFQNVMNWVKITFPIYRQQMKGLEWGRLYNIYHNNAYNSNTLETEIAALIADDDVENKKGIYEYVLTDKTNNNERLLNIRAFSESIKQKVYEKQKGICPLCDGANATKKWQLNEMEADHITPWSASGKTTEDNCQMLCKDCNRRKSANNRYKLPPVLIISKCCRKQQSNQK
ncbi:MAG: HNH endonuclease [Prevotellaceae bacterium]|jgi:hypothetical protein|nr:HNH endonuclease [Prevotellaceae bacterium]